MLVIKRKIGERIAVGQDIGILLISAGTTWAKIGIDAPRSVPVSRHENGPASLALSPAFETEADEFLRIASEYCADLSRMSAEQVQALEENPLNRVTLALARALVFHGAFQQGADVVSS